MSSILSKCNVILQNFDTIGINSVNRLYSGLVGVKGDFFALPFQEQSDARLGVVHHWTSVLPSLLQVPVVSGGVPLETC